MSGWSGLLGGLALLLGLLAAYLAWSLRRARQEAAAVGLRVAGELVQVMRHQRHSFMNHLQVISGWLQLGKPERAVAYIESLRRKREQEGQLFKLADWRLLALLLSKNGLAETSDVDLVWRVDNPLAGAAPELTEWVGARFDEAVAYATRQAGACRLEAWFRLAEGKHLVRLAVLDSAGIPVAGDAIWEGSFAPVAQ